MISNLEIFMDVVIANFLLHSIDHVYAKYPAWEKARCKIKEEKIRVASVVKAYVEKGYTIDTKDASGIIKMYPPKKENSKEI